MLGFAIVLAGGASRRMGVDKLSLKIGDEDDRSVLDHVVDVTLRVADQVRIVHAPQVTVPILNIVRRSDPRIQFHRDGSWHTGPLQALAEAWPEQQMEWVFVVAGDLPGLTEEVLESCERKLHDNGADAVLISREARLQPLLGCYRHKVGQAFRRAVFAGETRLMKVLEGLHTVAITAEQECWPKWWTQPVHTQEDYATWLHHWRQCYKEQCGTEVVVVSRENQSLTLRLECDGRPLYDTSND